MSKTWSEADQTNLPWCHIYAQHSWHMPVYIEGNKAALTIIRDALDKAITSGFHGFETVSESLFTHDGEGYHVEIFITTVDELESMPLPYTAVYAGGVGREAFNSEMADRRAMGEATAR